MFRLLISSRGRIVLPAPLRHKLAWVAGSRLEALEEPDGLKLRLVKSAPVSDMTQLAGMVRAASKGKPRSLKDLDTTAMMVRRPSTCKP